MLAGSSLFEVHRQTAKSVDKKRRGRIEHRTITVVSTLSASVNLPLYTGFAGVQQVARLERQTIYKRTGEFWQQSVLGITSLPARHVLGSAEALLGILRGHWHIENRSHYVRDKTYDEDRSQVRTGNLPQVMAALRNAAISVLRLAGHRNIAAACRFYAANPHRAIQLVKINRTE